MNKGYKTCAINNYSVRSYVIGGYRVRVNLGKDATARHSMKELEASNCEQASILRGDFIGGHRVHWSGLYKVAMIKLLAKRDGLKCNNPNCPSHKSVDEWIATDGLDWLQIDHKDNNRNNNCINNYQLLCAVCNQPRIKSKIIN